MSLSNSLLAFPHLEVAYRHPHSSDVVNWNKKVYCWSHKYVNQSKCFAANKANHTLYLVHPLIYEVGLVLVHVIVCKKHLHLLYSYSSKSLRLSFL
jgi:hypothetical protein